VIKEDRLKSFLKKIRLNESTISVILGALVIVVVGALIFNYFRSVKRPQEEVVNPEEIKSSDATGSFGETTYLLSVLTIKS